MRGDFKVRHYPFSQMTPTALQPGSGRPPIPHRWTASPFGPGPQFRMDVLKISLHGGRALIRSRLWDPEVQIERSSYPDRGGRRRGDRHIREANRHRLY